LGPLAYSNHTIVMNMEERHGPKCHYYFIVRFLQEGCECLQQVVRGQNLGSYSNKYVIRRIIIKLYNLGR